MDKLRQILEQQGAVVQTLILGKEEFKSAEEATRWAADHGFGHDKVDETGESFRLRQREPGDFKDGSFRTIELTKGVTAVIGRLREAVNSFQESFTGGVTESKDAEGRTWDAVIIQSGLSRNSRFYPDELLLKSAKLFEGARAYAYEFKGNYLDHLPDFAKAAMPEGFARNLVGWFESVRFDEFMGADGKAHTGLVATFHCTDDRIRQTFLNAWKEGKRDLLGFSIDVEGTVNKVWREGQLVDEVESIERVSSVDVVSVPAAGGQVVRLLASNGGGGMKEKLVALIKQYDPKLLEGLDEAAITEEQAWELLGKLLEGLKPPQDANAEEAKKRGEMAEAIVSAVLAGTENLKELFHGDEVLIEKALDFLKEKKVEDAIDLLKGLMEQRRKQPGNGNGGGQESAQQIQKQLEQQGRQTQAIAQEAVAQAKAAGEEARKAKEELALLKSQQTLTETLAKEAELPEPIKKRLRKRFEGRVFEAKELTEAVAEEKEILGALAESGEVTGLGAQTRVGLEESDRLQMAVDLALGYQPDESEKPKYQGIRPFRGLREMFHAFHRYPIEDDGRLSESQLRRIRETTTADFAFALGASMTRKLVKEYRRLPYDWRKMASVVPIDNFKLQERIRWGGLGVLPTVTESATQDYPELTFPTDERATYTPTKKGGLITVTREMILNDDLGVLRRLPNRIAIAANRQLNRFVFDLLVNFGGGAINGGTIYDALALYHANHLNNLTVALSYANLVTARQKLFQMPEYGTKDAINMGAGLAQGATTLTVDTGTKFKADDYVQAEAEIMRVTAVLGNDLTVVRGQFGTADAAHADNTAVYQITEPHLGLLLKYLVVPIELQNTAEILRRSDKVPGGNLNDTNTLKETFEVITSPFLRGDANNWYAVAGPDQLDLIEIGFVEGREEPVVLLQDQPAVGNVFMRDNVRYKVRHEYGGAVIDFRGFVGSIVA
ncbi:MAG: hypothetical protein HYZ89_05440 [Candidatus Omnitrophica bacterium]|nr:hypothetical protein [Candidatus Omnitrophota bacterium]